MIITTETQVFYLNRIIIIAAANELFELLGKSHLSNRNFGVWNKIGTQGG